MYDCKAPLSRFYYPDTRRIINAFIIIIMLSHARAIIASMHHYQVESTGPMSCLTYSE